MHKTFTVLPVPIIFRIVLIRAGRHMLHRTQSSIGRKTKKKLVIEQCHTLH
jgi:hypothetical protein